MTEHDGDPDQGPPELDSPEADAVRARLASEPAPRMPPEVAARLQEALRGESQARTAAWSEQAAPPQGEAQPPSNVTPLRRRRRWVAPLAAAAAVVAVVGIGIPVIQSMENGSDDASVDAGSSSVDDGGKMNDDSSAPDGGAPPGPDSELNESGGQDADGSTLHRSAFKAEVLAMQAAATTRLEALARAGQPEIECRNDNPRGEGAEPIRLDGDEAALTATREGDDTRYRAYVCESGEPTVAAETTLPTD